MYLKPNVDPLAVAYSNRRPRRHLRGRCVLGPDRHFGPASGFMRPPTLVFLLHEFWAGWARKTEVSTELGERDGA